jgi:hypothetical protein
LLASHGDEEVAMIDRKRNLMLRNRLLHAVLVVLFAHGVFSGCGQAQDLGTCVLPPSRKIDEYGATAASDEHPRLEKLLTALAAEKNSHAFIVTYADRHSTAVAAQRRADAAKSYLVEKFAFFGSEGTNSHINTIVCGYREAPATELWITPVGSAPPRCTPSVSAPQPLKRRLPRVRR